MRNSKKILAKIKLGLPITWQDKVSPEVLKVENARRVLGLVR